MKAFYTDAARPVTLDGTAVAHPYYVRTAASDPWLKSNTADSWEIGVVTEAVNTFEMLAWAKEQLKKDPALFIAAID